MTDLWRPEVRLLLGRDTDLIHVGPALQYLAPRTVLVTGAGSLGTAVCLLLADKVPRLHVCDVSETALYHLAQQGTGAIGHLCNLADPTETGEFLKAVRPDVVVHTAAHKHVGYVEEMPYGGVSNNVGGLISLLAGRGGAVDRFLLVSSDKAVAPTCVYGATKHVCERLVYGWGKADRFAVLRLVNILGSSGSVLPTFVRCVNECRPLTVTHPEVSRHFVTLAEAALAVVAAAGATDGRPLYTTPLHEPVLIADLAARVCSLYGKEPDIAYSALARVEKLAEVPVYPEEDLHGVPSGLVACLSPYPQPLEANNGTFDLFAATAPSGVRRELKKLVPDYEVTP